MKADLAFMGRAFVLYEPISFTTFDEYACCHDTEARRLLIRYISLNLTVPIILSGRSCVVEA